MIDFGKKAAKLGGGQDKLRFEKKRKLSYNRSFLPENAKKDRKIAECSIVQAFCYFVKLKANQYGHYLLDHPSRVRNGRGNRSVGTGD